MCELWFRLQLYEEQQRISEGDLERSFLQDLLIQLPLSRWERDFHFPLDGVIQNVYHIYNISDTLFCLQTLLWQHSGNIKVLKHHNAVEHIKSSWERKHHRHAHSIHLTLLYTLISFHFHLLRLNKQFPLS